MPGLYWQDFEISKVHDHAATRAGSLAARVMRGGRLARSGIQAGQEDELLQRYAEWFDGLRVARQDDWMRIEGVRR